jgi:hypothetical protein
MSIEHDNEIDGYIFSVNLNAIAGIPFDEAHEIWYTLPDEWRVYPRLAATQYLTRIKQNDSKPDTL